MANLSRLEKVDLRKAWNHEALDFTTWLAQDENLALLGETLGMELITQKSEASVGKFSLDILAADATTGHNVVIENQLESTNHSHLGQLLTYAAGYDASVVIWIVAESREEHRRAVEWLNERTDDRTGFFLVRIELWRIGSSLPAPKFNIVASPNAWAKTIGKSGAGAEPSATRMQQLDFWTQYKEYVVEQDPKCRLRTPAAQHWFDYSIGSSVAHVSLTINSQINQIAAELYIPNNKQLFYALKDQREPLEGAVGCQLTWDDTSGKAARIKIARSVDNVFDELNYPDYFEWLYQVHRAIERAFAPAIKKIMA